MYHTHYSVIVVQINDVCWWCFVQSSRLLQIWKAPFSPQLVWMTTFTLIFFANQFFCTVLVLLFSFSLSCCLTFCNILMTTGFPMSTVKRNKCVQFRTFVVRSIQYNSVICWNEFKKKLFRFFTQCYQWAKSEWSLSLNLELIIYWIRLIELKFVWFESNRHVFKSTRFHCQANNKKLGKHIITKHSMIVCFHCMRPFHRSPQSKLVNQDYCSSISF